MIAYYETPERLGWFCKLGNNVFGDGTLEVAKRIEEENSDFEEKRQKKTFRLTAHVVAKAIGWDEQYLRILTQEGKCPFGVAVKAPGANRYCYSYFPEKVAEYFGRNIEFNFGDDEV